jgi:hypothetical protein
MPIRPVRLLPLVILIVGSAFGPRGIAPITLESPVTQEEVESRRLELRAASVAAEREGAPYPSSPVIQGIAWDPPATIVRTALGSDNWPTTWGPDGHIYTAWGNGNGFGRTRMGLGVTRIEGSPEHFVGVNLWGVPENREEGKSYGIIAVGGVLYMWVGPEGGWTSSTET